MKAQKETGNSLLDTERKETLVIMGERLAELCPAIRWKASLGRNNLAEEISKQNVQGAIYFPLAVYCKMQEKDKLKNCYIY